MDSLEAPRDGGKVDAGFVDLGRRWFAARSRLSRLHSPHRIGGLPPLGSLIAFRRDRLALLGRAPAMGDVGALEIGVSAAVPFTSPPLAPFALQHPDRAGHLVGGNGVNNWFAAVGCISA